MPEDDTNPALPPLYDFQKPRLKTEGGSLPDSSNLKDGLHSSARHKSLGLLRFGAYHKDPLLYMDIEFEQKVMRVWEDVGKLSLTITRKVKRGSVSVRIYTEDLSAKTGVNFSYLNTVVKFKEGQSKAKIPVIDIFNSPRKDGELRFLVKMHAETEGAEMEDFDEKNRREIMIYIDDEESRISTCIKNSPVMEWTVLFFTVFALFAHDIWMLNNIPKEYDPVLGWLTVFCFLLFIFEWIITAMALGSSYYWSTTGFLDLLAAVGVLTLVHIEIKGVTITFNEFISGTELARAARVARIAARAGRATRIPKLLGKTVSCVITTVLYCLHLSGQNTAESQEMSPKLSTEKKRMDKDRKESSNLNDSGSAGQHTEAVTTNSATSPIRREVVGHSNRPNLPSRINNMSTISTTQTNQQHLHDVEKKNSGQQSSSIHRHRQIEMTNMTANDLSGRLGRGGGGGGEEERQPRRRSGLQVPRVSIASQARIQTYLFENLDNDQDKDNTLEKSEDSSNELLADPSKVGGMMLEVLTSKIMMMMLILLLLITTLASFQRESATQRDMGLQMLKDTAEMDSLNGTSFNAVKDVYLSGGRHLGTRWNSNKPCIYLKVNGTEFVVDSDKLKKLRSIEMTYSSIGSGCGDKVSEGDLRQDSCLDAAIFNQRKEVIVTARNGLILTFSLTVIVTIGMAFIAYDFQNLIFGPILRIKMSVERAFEVLFGDLFADSSNKDGGGGDEDDDNGSNDPSELSEVEEEEDCDDVNDNDDGKEEKYHLNPPSNFIRFHTHHSQPRQGARGKTAGYDDDDDDDGMTKMVFEDENKEGEEYKQDNPVGLFKEEKKHRYRINDHKIDIPKQGFKGEQNEDDNKTNSKKRKKKKRRSKRERRHKGGAASKSFISNLFNIINPRPTDEQHHQEWMNGLLSSVTHPEASRIHMLNTLLPTTLFEKWSQLQIQISTALVDIEKAFGVKTGRWNENLRKFNGFMTHVDKIRNDLHNSLVKQNFSWDWFRDHIIKKLQTESNLTEPIILQFVLDQIQQCDYLRHLTAITLSVYENRIERKANSSEKATFNATFCEVFGTSVKKNDYFVLKKEMGKIRNRLATELQTMDVNTFRDKLITVVAVETLRLLHLMKSKKRHATFLDRTMNRVNVHFVSLLNISPEKKDKIRLWKVVSLVSNVIIQDITRFVVSEACGDAPYGSKHSSKEKQEERKKADKNRNFWKDIKENDDPDKILQKVQDFLCQRGVEEIERLLREAHKDDKKEEDVDDCKREKPTFMGDRNSLQDIRSTLARMESTKMTLPENIASLFQNTRFHRYLSVMAPFWNLRYPHFASCSTQKYLSGLRDILMNTLFARKFGHRIEILVIQIYFLLRSVTTQHDDPNLSRAMWLTAVNKRKSKLLRLIAKSYFINPNRKNSLERAIKYLNLFTGMNQRSSEKVEDPKLKSMCQEESISFSPEEALAFNASLTKKLIRFSEVVEIMALLGRVPSDKSVENTISRFVVFALGVLVPAFTETAEILDPLFSSKEIVESMHNGSFGYDHHLRRKDTTEELLKSMERLTENFSKQILFSALREKKIVPVHDVFHTKFNTEIEQKLSTHYVRNLKERGVLDEVFQEGVCPTLDELHQHVKNLLKAKALEKVPWVDFHVDHTIEPLELRRQLSSQDIIPHLRDERVLMAEQKFHKLSLPKSVADVIEEHVLATGTAPLALIAYFHGEMHDLVRFPSTTKLIFAMGDLRVLGMLMTGICEMFRSQGWMAKAVYSVLGLPMSWIMKMNVNVLRLWTSTRKSISEGTFSLHDLAELMKMVKAGMCSQAAQTTRGEEEVGGEKKEGEQKPGDGKQHHLHNDNISTGNDDDGKSRSDTENKGRNPSSSTSSSSSSQYFLIIKALDWLIHSIREVDHFLLDQMVASSDDDHKHQSNKTAKEAENSDSAANSNTDQANIGKVADINDQKEGEEVKEGTKRNKRRKRKIHAANSVDLNMIGTCAKHILRRNVFTVMEVINKLGGKQHVFKEKRMSAILTNKKLSFMETWDVVCAEFIAQVFCCNTVLGALFDGGAVDHAHDGDGDKKEEEQGEGMEKRNSVFLKRFDQCKTPGSALRMAEKITVESFVGRILRYSRGYIRADQRLQFESCTTLKDLRKTIKKQNKQMVRGVALSFGIKLRKSAEENLHTDGYNIDEILKEVPQDLSKFFSDALEGSIFMQLVTKLSLLYAGAGVQGRGISVLSSVSVADLCNSIKAIREVALSHGFAWVGPLSLVLDWLKMLDMRLQLAMVSQGFIVQRPSVDTKMGLSFVAHTCKKIVTDSLNSIEIDSGGIMQFQKEQIIDAFNAATSSLFQRPSSTTTTKKYGGITSKKQPKHSNKERKERQEGGEGKKTVLSSPTSSLDNSNVVTTSSSSQQQQATSRKENGNEEGKEANDASSSQIPASPSLVVDQEAVNSEIEEREERDIPTLEEGKTPSSLHKIYQGLQASGIAIITQLFESKIAEISQGILKEEELQSIKSSAAAAIRQSLAAVGEGGVGGKGGEPRFLSAIFSKGKAVVEDLSETAVLSSSPSSLSSRITETKQKDEGKKDAADSGNSTSDVWIVRHLKEEAIRVVTEKMIRLEQLEGKKEFKEMLAKAQTLKKDIVEFDVKGCAEELMGNTDLILFIHPLLEGVRSPIGFWRKIAQSHRLRPFLERLTTAAKKAIMPVSNSAAIQQKELKKENNGVENSAAAAAAAAGNLLIRFAHANRNTTSIMETAAATEPGDLAGLLYDIIRSTTLLT